MRAVVPALLAFTVARVVSTPAEAAMLAVDLSNPVIEITTSFAGADVLLFGAIDRGSDVIVVISGPSQRQIVRRKSRIAGIWVNADSRTFDTVPAYYRVASTRPLEDVAKQATLRRLAIGTQRLRLGYAKNQPKTDMKIFRDALIRNKVRARLYAPAPLPVSIADQRLFRTTFDFPANVPTGAYKVHVYLLRAGRIVSQKTRTLQIEKVGMEANIFDFAHKYSAFYGIIAIVIALFCGWLAGVIFRRA